MHYDKEKQFPVPGEACMYLDKLLRREFHERKIRTVPGAYTCSLTLCWTILENRHQYPIHSNEGRYHLQGDEHRP